MFSSRPNKRQESYRTLCQHYAYQLHMKNTAVEPGLSQGICNLNRRVHKFYGHFRISVVIIGRNKLCIQCSTKVE